MATLRITTRQLRTLIAEALASTVSPGTIMSLDGRKVKVRRVSGGNATVEFIDELRGETQSVPVASLEPFTGERGHASEPPPDFASLMRRSSRPPQAAEARLRRAVREALTEGMPGEGGPTEDLPLPTRGWQAIVDDPAALRRVANYIRYKVPTDEELAAKYGLDVKSARLLQQYALEGL